MSTTPTNVASGPEIATEASSSPSGKPVVVAQRLSKVFRDFWMRDRVRAVDDLTFHIEPHEIFGLLGPNGSGKSTTIKMILGLLHPSKGRLAVFGRSPSDVAIKARIGYLPEESFLYPFLNARETLDYYGKLFHIQSKTRTKRIDELLDMVGLTAAQFRPVREYSKGMQRRIGLAQALINDPDFLILDEPTTGLDPIGTRQVKDLILELGRRGKTVLLSSHLLADVEDVVDRMAILYGGKKRDEGTTDSLLTSQNRTTIETDALDDDTIAAIDRLLRERSRGEQGLIKVSHPRMKLEQKFLDIVQNAQAERVATSGASAGGQTAAFLTGDSGASGEDLIDRLTTAEPVGDATQAKPEAVAPETPDADLLAELVADESAPKTTSPSPGEPVSREPVSQEAVSSDHASAGPGSAESGATSERDGGDGSSEKPPAARPPVPPAPPADDVDMDVIGSLLDSDEPGDDKADETEGPTTDDPEKGKGQQ